MSLLDVVKNEAIEIIQTKVLDICDYMAFFQQNCERLLNETILTETVILILIEKDFIDDL
jgi:hypothetical protein